MDVVDFDTDDEERDVPCVTPYAPPMVDFNSDDETATVDCACHEEMDVNSGD